MALNFFEALKVYRKDIIKDLPIRHIQTVDRWIRTKRINPVYRSMIIEYFAKKEIKIS